MPIRAVESPLSPDVPEEIPLAHAPLVSVLAQVRYPAQPGIDSRETVEPFFVALRQEYPVVREEAVRGLTIQPFQVTDPTRAIEAKAWTIWRLSDIASKWRVSLARDFIALETSTGYENHADFVSRFRRALEAIPTDLQPPVIDRFGLRYVDRMRGKALEQIGTLVRSELLGVQGTAAARNVIQSIAETVFETQDGRLIARWGLLPANASYDPGTLAPISEPSWVLDLDMARELTRPFDIAALSAEARVYADRIYTFFRWAVRQEFLDYYNGQEAASASLQNAARV